jgi:hypothetical protein
MTATSSKPEADEAIVVLVAIVANVKNCGLNGGADTPRPNRYTWIGVERSRECAGSRAVGAECADSRTLARKE